MAVYKAEMKDVAEIAKVNIATWKTAYKGIIPDDFIQNISREKKEANVRNALLDDSIRALVYKDDAGKIVGYVLFGKEREENPEFRGEIYAIYVLQEYQGTGIGRILYGEAVGELKAMGFASMIIWTLKDYKSCGFYECIGGRKAEETEADFGGKMLKLVGYGFQI